MSDREGSMDIHVMGRQGRHLAQLTDRRAHDTRPNWHPRGTAIALQSDEGGGDDGDIHTIETDGSGERRLTKHPANDSDPRWSPDGTQILFTSGRDGADALFVMDLDGRIIRRVTSERFIYIEGSSWYDPDFPRSVSALGRHAATWGWIKRFGALAR
jgi:TolB protein